MTNQEAIKIIKNYEVNGCGYCHQGGNEIPEAFEMAIEALRTCNKTCNKLANDCKSNVPGTNVRDTINRQATIEKMSDICFMCDENQGGGYCGACKYEELISVVKELPTEQTDHVAESGKEDCISRQAAIDVLNDMKFIHNFECGEYIGEDTRELQIVIAEKAINAIFDLPTFAQMETENRRKTGKWIYNQKAYPFMPYGHYDCDQCGEMVTGKSNFCPNCGADMGGEIDDK